MEHFSELLKILDGGLRHNPRQVTAYAGLLADKLERDGAQAQARMIRERLARAPISSISPQTAASTSPVDKESQLSILDECLPDLAGLDVVFGGSSFPRLQEFLISVRRYGDLAAAGVALPSRLLLHGPPGCGKTLIARWTAAQLSLPLMTVRCDTLVSSLLGQTSRNLRQVFEYADSRPCVLFLDEFDALAKARSDEREVGELQRVVIALLQNIDSINPATVLIAATNHDELLDRAVWRRFSFVISVDLPDVAQRKQLWRVKLGKYAPDEKGIDLLGAYSDGLSGAAIEAAAFDVVRDAVLHGKESVKLPDALRRTARMRWLRTQQAPSNEEAEIRALREWLPDVFTYRALEELFDRNSRQIGNALREANEQTGQSNSKGRRTSSRSNAEARRR